MAGRSSRDDRPIPAHPYRDAAIVYGIMSVVLVAAASVTGGDIPRAGLVAVIFFVVATAWTSWRFRSRIRERDTARAEAAASEEDGGDDGSTNGNGRGGSGA
jgi:membrane protein implicated in regulation of membrane protease activity